MIQFVAGWVVGSAVTFLVLGLGWSYRERELRAQHLADLMRESVAAWELGRSFGSTQTVEAEAATAASCRGAARRVVR